MPNIQPPSVERVAVFEQVQSEALEVLCHPKVHEAIGDHTSNLQHIIEDSFVVQGVLGAVIVPVHLRGVKAVGFYPMLPGDPDTVTYALSDWVDRDVSSQHTIGSEPRKVTGVSTQRTIRKVVGFKNSESIVAAEPFIISGRRFPKSFTPEVRAAITAHEYDHCYRYQEMHRTNDRLADGNSPQLIVELERSAYKVTAAMLGCFAEPVFTSADISKQVRQLEPVAAGTWLRDLVSAEQDTPFKTRAQRLHVLALGFAALSELFNPDQIGATQEEIVALTAAGVIAQPKQGDDWSIERL